MAYSSALGRPYTGEEWARIQANLRALKKAQKRAGKGKRSLWTADDQRRLQDGPHYDRDEQLVGEMRRLHLAAAPRPNTLTEEAEQARDAVRRHRRKPITLTDPDVVPEPYVQRTVGIDNLTGGAAIFAKAALRAGCDVYAGMVWQDDDVTGQVVLAVRGQRKARGSWPTGKPASAAIRDGGASRYVGVTEAKTFITEGAP